MSPTSSDTDGSVEPHILCDYCRATCDSSIIIQTYTKYGNDETYAVLRERCRPMNWRENFEHCSVTDFQAGYQTGCHLCSMLWRRAMGRADVASRLMQEMKDFEEKNGISKSVLAIDCNGINNTVEIALCTRTKDAKFLRGFALHGYLVRDFQGNLQPSFPLEPYFQGDI